MKRHITTKVSRTLLLKLKYFFLTLIIMLPLFRFKLRKSLCTGTVVGECTATIPNGTIGHLRYYLVGESPFEIDADKVHRVYDTILFFTLFMIPFYLYYCSKHFDLYY